jgi:hypothetical protein
MTKLLLQALSYVDEVTVPESNEKGGKALITSIEVGSCFEWNWVNCDADIDLHT